MNITGKRVEEAIREAGLDQPTLAAELGVSQGSISKIVSGRTARSRLLPEIALRVRKPLAYLLGESDDANMEAAHPPPPEIRHVMMPVALPEERALIRMFEALLRVMPPGSGLEEQAELLAKRLPIGLAQLRDLLPAERPASDAPATRALQEAFATPGRARRP